MDQKSKGIRRKALKKIREFLNEYVMLSESYLDTPKRKRLNEIDMINIGGLIKSKLLEKDNYHNNEFEIRIFSFPPGGRLQYIDNLQTTTKKRLYGNNIIRKMANRILDNKSDTFSLIVFIVFKDDSTTYIGRF